MRTITHNLKPRIPKVGSPQFLSYRQNKFLAAGFRFAKKAKDIKLKTLLTWVTVLVCTTSASAQLSPIQNEYVVNPFLINPAYAGINQSTSLKLTNRMQWGGFDNSPRIQTLSYDMRIKALGKYNHTGKVLRKSGIPRSGRVGVGASFINDLNKPFRRSGIQLSYAYHIPFQHGEKGQLSLGISGSFYQHYINMSDFKPADPSDPATSSQESVLFPNLNFGANYLYKDFFVSVSALNLYPAKVKHYNENIETIDNQLYVFSGYQIGESTGFSVTPVLMWRNNPNAVDVNVKLTLKEKSNLVLAWQSTETIFAFFHFKFGNYLLGYSFEHSMGDIQDYNDGTHLVFLGYQFN